MVEKKYGGDYLNNSLAICVLGIGMMIIASMSLHAQGAFQVLIGGAGIGYYGAGRLHGYNRSGDDKKD